MIDFKNFEKFYSKFEGKKIYVGFSGGSDSLALLVISNHFKTIFNFDLCAVNFEHGIRGQDSIEDSEFCKLFCESRDIPFISYSLGIDKNAKNVECLARQLRFQKYQEILTDKLNSIVLLGHHLNDKIENFFIRLSRGSNISGLCGLKESTIIEGINFQRPFLSIKKFELEDFLKRYGYSWRIDNSNFDNYYTRNYIRNILLPEWYKNEGLIEGGIRSAIENVEVDADFINSIVANEYEKIKNFEYLRIDHLLSYHLSIRTRLVKLWIIDHKGNFIINKNFLDQFNKTISVINLNRPRVICLKDGDKLLIKANKIYFVKFNS